MRNFVVRLELRLKFLVHFMNINKHDRNKQQLCCSDGRTQ